MKYSFLFFTFCWIAQFLNAQEWNTKGPKAINIKYDDLYPIQLLHADSQQIIITKGNENWMTKEIEFLNSDFKSIRKIKVASTKNERVDHIIWTGEQLILLWEKNVHNKRSLSYQLIGVNGRAASKVNLGVIPNGLSPYLRNHQVDIIHNPDYTLFAFVVKDIISKNYRGKNAEYADFIAVFDKSGKLLEKQQNKYNTFQQLDAYHFISNDSLISKWVSNWDKNTFQVTQKHLTDKSKQTTQVTVDLPPRTKVISYHLEYNSTTHTMDIMGQTRSHDTIIGMNGIFFNKYTLESLQKNGQWLYPLDSIFVADFTKSSKFKDGIILYKDNSLSNDFNLRKLVPTSDGGWYLIQEYYPKYLPDFIKNDIEIAVSSTFKNQFNVDYKYNTPLNMSDLIVSYIQKDGTITWSKRIPKPQEGLSHQWGSFEAFILNNDVYILYNIEVRGKSFVKNLDNQHVVIGNINPIVWKVNTEGQSLKVKSHQNVDKDFVFFPQFSNSISQLKKGYIFLQKNSVEFPSQGRLVEFIIE